jgi:plastocyanin
VTSTSVTGDLGGQRVGFLVSFRRPGRFPFYCQYHRSAGMAGTFQISG